jgi:hypothetical protein
VSGLAYWTIVRNGNGFRCIYGDPACSLTVATWLLVIATAAAFLAAFKAAKEAIRTYDVTSSSLALARRMAQLEQAQLFAERSCHRVRHEAPTIRRWIIPLRDTEEIKVLEQSPEMASPSSEQFPSFNDPDLHDIFNLGRSPIVDPSVDVEFSFTKRPTLTARIKLPSIPVAGDVHVMFYVAKSLGQVDVRWYLAERTESQRELTIVEFYPQQRAKRESEISLSFGDLGA